jgi:hypothetical protein
MSDERAGADHETVRHTFGRESSLDSIIGLTFWCRLRSDTCPMIYQSFSAIADVRYSVPERPVDEAVVQRNLF